MKKIENLQINNSFSRLTHHEFYSKVEPTPLSNQHLISFNPQAAALIGLDPDEALRDDFCDIFSGTKKIENFYPLAMCYAGHQFGKFVSRLGDGRAILLSQVEHENKKWDLHLKGAGQTPYSRGSDGRAVLRSTIREYLCSEAMHGLGIASSRSLCMIGSDEEVYREQIETGAMMIRMAPSHIRFGSFEYFYHSNQHAALRELADYVIAEYYPEFEEQDNPYLALLKTCINTTALMIAQWQSVGFAHGVMNTDNMSIHGLTLDYGPFGFLDAFNPDFVCNHSDYQGRYAFKKQPEIGLFNLSCLAQALLPLFDDDADLAAELAKAELANYQTIYLEYYHQIMNRKLGLGKIKAGDIEIQENLLELLQKNNTDFTIFFRGLSNDSKNLRNLFIEREQFDLWQQNFHQRIKTCDMSAKDRKQNMLTTNPKYILRNHLLETAIRQAADSQDHAEIENLLKVCQSPFDEHPEFEHYADHPPAWASQIEVSCSS